MTRFDRELAHVYEMYALEPFDSVTLKHMNAHAQSRVPGPYKLVEGVDGSIHVHFTWSDPQQQVLWALQWF